MKWKYQMVLTYNDITRAIERKIPRAQNELMGNIFLWKKENNKQCAWRKSTENGGAEGDRTPDLYAASVALSQLSYSPRLHISFYHSTIVNLTAKYRGI